MITETKLPSYSEGLKTLQENLGKMLPAEALATFEKDANALENEHDSILKLQEGLSLIHI